MTITLFESQGMAIQDLAVALRVVQAAEAQGPRYAIAPLIAARRQSRMHAGVFGELRRSACQGKQ